MSVYDNSSTLTIFLDSQERFVGFEFVRAVCGKTIKDNTKYTDYCKGLTLGKILKINFNQAVKALRLRTDEQKYFLYLEWSALRSAIAQYQGLDNEQYDAHRCQIVSIEHSKKGVCIEELILPPKELPQIGACPFVKKNLS